MKHIKTYTLYESVLKTKSFDVLQMPEVVNNCKDILLELDDEGFITNVIHTNRYPYNIIVLKIRRRLIHGEYDEENLFKYSEIEEYVERTIDYLETETDFMMVKASIVLLKRNGLETLNIENIRGECVNKLRDFMNKETINNTRYLSMETIPRKDKEIIQTIYLQFTR